MMRRTTLAMTVLLTTLPAMPSAAQEPLPLDDSCTVTVGNQTAVVRPDGTFFIRNISVFESRDTGVAPQLYRVRATCLRESQMLTGQSEFFSLDPGTTTFIASVFPSQLDPIPVSLAASAAAEVVPLGASVQIAVTATLPDGGTEDVTPRSAGTTYLSTNPNLLHVDENGRVTGVNSTTTPQTGTIAILNEGNLATLSFQAVGPSNDFDNDGMPNDFEELFGLNPFFNDANGDLDGDGLTNLEEFELGTLPNNPDTDLDGVPDGLDGDPLRPEESPPTVRILVPADGATVLEGETLSFSVEARDDGLLAGVELSVNGVDFGTLTAPPFQVPLTIPFAAGFLQLSATATDGVGNTVTATHSVFVSPDPFTTVTGRVTDTDGNPVAGAEVTLLLGGLQGELFDFDTPLETLPDLDGLTPDVVQPISALNFLNPDGLLSPDTFGAGFSPDFAGRFTGRIRVPETGLYDFILAADDGARLTIGGVLVVEVPGGAGELAAAIGSVNLPAGILPIEVDYFQSVGDSELQLAVRGPGETAASVVLPSDLRQPGDFFTATTGVDGFFSFSDVPNILGDLRAEARAVLDGEEAQGVSAPTAPVPGGLTDLGDLAVTTAQFEPDFGINLFQFDDDSDLITFGGGFTFPFLGVERTGIFVNSNGNLTFGGGDTTFDPAIPLGIVNGLARISPLFTDLNPSAGGAVFVNQFPDRFVVTWSDVPQFNEGGSNTFQVILFSDGRIQYGYNGLTADGFGDGAANDTLDISVAVSPGGTPALRTVDYTADTPFVSVPGEAPFEHFNVDGSFDLDGGFVIFRPDAGGGFDVRFIPPQQGLGTASLEGTVLDAAGKPLANREVWLRDSRGHGVRGVTAADGTFRFEGLPAGVLYTVEAYDGDTLLGRSHAHLREVGQETTLAVKPSPHEEKEKR